jgi:Domain of unknown function (DUF4878)
MGTARIHALGLHLLALALVTCAVVPPLSAQGRTPLDAYKAYLDAASKATKPDALFPHVSKEYKTLLQSAPKTEVDKMIKMHIAKDKLTDIAVKNQQVDAKKAVLELTAKTGDGRPAQGTATLVKEDGAWKLDEDAWAVPPKKQ